MAKTDVAPYSVQHGEVGPLAGPAVSRALEGFLGQLPSCTWRLAVHWSKEA